MSRHFPNSLSELCLAGLASHETVYTGLHDAGIAIWFDQNELRGGEVWDRQIRDRIDACSLFIAVVSAYTQARDQGYFRRERKLAVDRTEDLADGGTFVRGISLATGGFL